MEKQRLPVHTLFGTCQLLVKMRCECRGNKEWTQVSEYVGGRVTDEFEARSPERCRLTNQAGQDGQVGLKWAKGVPRRRTGRIVGDEPVGVMSVASIDFNDPKEGMCGKEFPGNCMNKYLSERWVRLRHLLEDTGNTRSFLTHPKPGTST